MYHKKKHLYKIPKQVSLSKELIGICLVVIQQITMLELFTGLFISSSSHSRLFTPWHLHDYWRRKRDENRTEKAIGVFFKQHCQRSAGVRRRNARQHLKVTTIITLWLGVTRDECFGEVFPFPSYTRSPNLFFHFCKFLQLLFSFKQITQHTFYTLKQLS